MPYNTEKQRNIAIGIFLIACLLTWLSAEALGSDLARLLAKVSPTEFFPHADRYGEVAATAPIAPVLQGDKVLGFVFLNTDFVSAIGYSGKPIKIVIIFLGSAGQQFGEQISGLAVLNRIRINGFKKQGIGKLKIIP